MKATFLWMSKVAGTSVYNALKGHVSVEGSLTPTENFDPATFTFTFVRNSWDRVASCWWYLTNVAKVVRDIPPDKKALVYPGQSFEDFVTRVLTDDKMFDPSLPTNQHKRWRGTMKHWFPQDLYMDQFGEINFVGRFENLSKDFSKVCEMIGKPGKKLPHKNSTKGRRKDYRRVYTDKTRGVVAQRYAGEIERFGYAFE